MLNPKIMHCVLLHKSLREMLPLAYVKRCLVVWGRKCCQRYLVCVEERIVTFEMEQNWL